VIAFKFTLHGAKTKMSAEGNTNMI